MEATMKRAWAVVVFWLMAMLCTAAAGASTVTYYHNDLAGSPAVATDASGQVIWRESYRPYGERLTNSPASSTNDVWFTSRRQDQETGLVYMGARYYDPVAGRFISTDPKGFDEANVHSFNRYAYANNNPYKYRDPDGRWAQLLVRAEYSVVVAVATRLGAGAAGSWIGEKAWNILHQEESTTPQATSGEAPVRDVVVPSDKYPESAGHIQDAQGNGQPDVLTIDRKGAKGRRADAMNGQPTVAGQDRDEYPPAMFGEGGKGASVRPISPSDNRGAGACIGAQCRDLADGSRIRIVPE